MANRVANTQLTKQENFTHHMTAKDIQILVENARFRLERDLSFKRVFCGNDAFSFTS